LLLPPLWVGEVGATDGPVVAAGSPPTLRFNGELNTEAANP